MKPKQLVPLAIVALVLAGLVVLRQWQQAPPQLQEQYSLTPLVPQGFEPDSLDRIEFYPGGNEDAKQVLQRRNGEWLVASHYNAPVLETKIQELLETLTGLSGEFRATAGENGLEAYQLDTETGFHMLGFTEGSDEPVFHVISGKSPDLEQAFARAADSTDVYVIDSSLRREVGIYTANMDDAPEPDPWLDKSIVNLDSTAIKQVALEYPDKRLTFALQQEDQPEDSPEDPSPQATEDTEETPTGETSEERGETSVEWNWVVAKGGPSGMQFNSNAVTNLTRRVSRLRATDIVDPSKLRDWNLESPEYRVTLTVDTEDKPIVLEVGRPEDDTSVYVRRADREGIVYKVSGYEFEQIFQEGGEFFELPGILVEESAVDFIEYTLADRRIRLERDGEEWNVVLPRSDVPIDRETADELVRAALSWKAADYADPSTDAGLGNDPDRLLIQGPDVQHTVVVGNITPSEGRYVQLDGGGLILAMSEADAAAIFANYGDLFVSELFDLSAGDVASYSLTWNGVTAKAARAEDGWTLTLDGEAAPPNGAVLDDLAKALVSLEARDFIFGSDREPEDPIATVTLTTEGETVHTLYVEPQQDGSYPVRLDGVEAVYLIPAESVGNILVDQTRLERIAEAVEAAEPRADQGDDAEIESAADGSAPRGAPPED